MAVKKITTGKIYCQDGEGQKVTMVALTKTASTTVEGETLTNRQYLCTGRAPWNAKEDYKPVIRINGVVSGCAVTGDAVTNNVQVAAGYANVNGTLATVTGDTTVAVTRPANGKKNVNAVCVDNAGTISVVVGSDGDSHDLTGGYGGAGQKPLTATTLAVLAYVALSEDEAAVVPDTDIYAGEDANVGYRIDHLRGGIVLDAALPLNKTGDVSRAIYATFYDLTSALVPLGRLEEAVLTITKAAPVKIPNHDSVWDQYVTLPGISWNLTVKKWRADQVFVDRYLDPDQDEFYLKMMEDKDDSYAYYGFGILNGTLTIGTSRGPSSESLTFTGNGELRRV